MGPSGHPLGRTLQGCGLWLDALPDGPDARTTLIQRLTTALLGQSPPWTLEHTPLGAPRLRLLAVPEPLVHISFSRARGLLWAAVGRAPLGLDAAGPEEFGADYPLARAFAPGELALARELCPRPESAPALLWALKEAVAKALGTGFHRLEPLEITAGPLERRDKGLRGMVRTPCGSAPVLAEQQDESVNAYWLALALAPQGPEDTHE